MRTLVASLFFSLAGCIPPISIPVAPGDGGTETGTPDGGTPDGGTPDGGGTDGGGVPDGGTDDTGDGGTPDGGVEDGGTEDGGGTEIVDTDLDGYTEEDGDCNDADATVNPSATELCDSVDNNCDGETDEATAADAPTWYADGDTDGYGRDDELIVACTEPEGYVELGGDCNDESAAYNPGAIEDDCTDPEDYNCDGSTGYADVDEDGWSACEECNDADSAINPGAVELCDGADNNCDGETDEATAADAPTWYADGDTDGYGEDDVNIVACTQPEGYVELGGDCNDANSAAFPGNPEVCDGTDNDCANGVDDGDVCDTGTSDGGGDTGGDGGDTGIPDGGTPGDGGTDGGTTDGGDPDGGTDDTGTGVGGDTGGTGDGGYTATVVYSTDFGDGSTCSYSPFARSDGGTMTYASYSSGDECGVYAFGSGSASGPSVALAYSAGGYTPGVEYTVEMTVENVVASAVTFYTDFGGGTTVSESVSAGGVETVIVTGRPDGAGNATLQAWTNYSTSYGVVIHDLVISYE